MSPSDQSRRRGLAQGVLAYVFSGLRNPVHDYAGDSQQKLNIAEIRCTVRQDLRPPGASRFIGCTQIIAERRMASRQPAFA
jgi:hypothetical protein